MNTFKLVPKSGVKLTQQLKAEIKLAEGVMNKAFDKSTAQKQAYDIVCAVSLGNMTEEQAAEQIKLIDASHLD